MNAIRTALAAIIPTILIGAAQAQTADSPPPPAPPAADLRYAERVEPRFLEFAGSSTNLANMTTGLRSGTEFTITGAGGETATIVPPTKPMGYGNITRALDLANRDLLAHGITNPTNEQIAAALNGGSFTNADGTTTQLSGVLNLRSQGMGWGQVAQTLKLHPGLGSGKAAPPAAPTGAPTASSSSSSGATTAAGAARSGATGGTASRPSGGITTALGTRVTQPGVRHAYGRSSGANGSVGTAASASGVVTAGGAGTSGGVVTAGGGRASANGASRGHNGHGRGGKN